MTWLHAANSVHGAGVWLHASFGGQGVRGDAVPTTGLNGPPLLYPGLSLPAEAADEFRASVLTIPAALVGLVTFGEDSSLEVSEAAPAGTHIGTWRGHKNGAVYGPDPSTYTIVVGAGLSGSATLDGIGATGTLSGGTPSQLGGAATLDGIGAGGGMGAVPSDLSGSATLDDVGAGGGILGELPPSGDITGSATLDDVGAEGNLFGGAPSVLPRAIMDETPTTTRIVRAGRTTPTYLQPLDVDAIDDVHFDFQPAIVGVDVILAVTVTCEARVGTDANAGAMRVGDPVFTADAAVQRFRGGIADVIYLLRATATMASGRKLPAVGLLPVVRAL